MKSLVLMTILCALCLSTSAHAQEPTDDSQSKQRTTGLPGPAENWSFNLDAGYGAFAFSHSLYAKKEPDPSGNLSDNWQESYVKPAISGDFPVGGGAFFGKLSAIGERTFSAPPPLVGGEASSYEPEDAYVGWRSGDARELGKNAIELTVGRVPYKIGHGFLLWDGAGDGGSRGGFWSGARKDWRLGSVARLKLGANTLEGFYLERDDLPENNTHTSLYGANYQLNWGEEDANSFGLTYIKTKSTVIADRDGMSVYDGRLFTSLPIFTNLSVELEVAHEENGSRLNSDAWTAQAAYKFSFLPWTPQLSYRYSFFKGDDPATSKNEAFDSLFTGFYDWGTWWQGEIGGEYFLSNSNLQTHQLRLHLIPGQSVSGGLIGYAFRNNQPATFAPNVTSHDIAVEVDGYVDWKINKNFTTSFVLATADPRAALEQGYQRTEKLNYGMVYVSYSY
jgi:hypothetical protein